MSDSSFINKLFNKRKVADTSLSPKDTNTVVKISKLSTLDLKPSAPALKSGPDTESDKEVHTQHIHNTLNMDSTTNSNNDQLLE